MSIFEKYTKNERKVTLQPIFELISLTYIFENYITYNIFKYVRNNQILSIIVFLKLKILNLMDCKVNFSSFFMYFSKKLNLYF